MLNLIVLIQALFSVIKEGVVQNQRPPTTVTPTTDHRPGTTDHRPLT